MITFPAHKQIQGKKTILVPMIGEYLCCFAKKKKKWMTYNHIVSFINAVIKRQ